MGACCEKAKTKEGRLLDYDHERARGYNSDANGTITIPPRDISSAAVPRSSDRNSPAASTSPSGAASASQSRSPSSAAVLGAGTASTAPPSRGHSAALGGVGSNAAAAPPADSAGSAAPADIPGAPSSSLLMRHVLIDPRKLQAIVDHAEESYLEVDRGIMGVTRDDPDDPGNQELVARLRATDIPPSSEAARLLAAALPRSSLHSPEGVASALTAAAAPRGSQAPVEEVSRRVAQAADSFALRDTGLPIVMGFSSASGPHSHAVRVGGAGRR